MFINVEFCFCLQTVALVRESGNGKSTAISLIEKFYDPDCRHVTLEWSRYQEAEAELVEATDGIG